MKDKLLNELKTEWGFCSDEIEAIKIKMAAYGSWCYSQGITYAENLEKTKSIYGRKEDQE